MGYPWPTYLPIFSGAQEASWDPSELTSLIDEWDAASGCVTDGALALTGTEYLSHAGNALLRGGTTWWRAGWFKPTDIANVASIVSSLQSGNINGFQISQRNVSGRLRLGIGTGSAFVSKEFVSGAAFSNGTWGFWYCQHDGTDLGLSLDNEALQTQTAAFSASNSVFEVGAWNTATLATGDEQTVMGGDGNLSAANITALYNAGAGVAHEDIPGIIGTTDTFCFPLGEASGARIDTIGGLSLSAVNAPGVAAGVAEGAAVNNSPVKSQTGVFNATVRSQSDITKQPLWIANSGDPYLDLDGTNHYFDITLSYASTSHSYYVRHDPTGVAGAGSYFFGTTTGRLILTQLALTNGKVGIYDNTAWREPGNAASGDQVLSFVLDGAGTSGSIYKDGVIVGSAFTYAPRAVGGTTGFFTSNTIGTATYDGKVYKDVLVASALTDAERASLDSYMGV